MVLGRLGAPWGVQGWLKVESYTDPPDAILDYPVWELAAPGGGAPVREVHVLGGRPHGGKRTVLVRLEGIDSPEAAKPYATLEVLVLRSALPPAGPPGRSRSGCSASLHPAPGSSCQARSRRGSHTIDC